MRKNKNILMKKNLTIVLLLLSAICKGQIITTFAGTGTMGYSGDGGTAILSKIDHPVGISIDKNGELLLCHKNAIRKINLSTNYIITVAGSDTASSLGGGGNGGPATCAQLVEPYAVCTDRDNNIYTADYWTSRVRYVNNISKIIDVYAGSAMGSSVDNIPATMAKLNGPTWVAIDTVRNRLYISDCWNKRVRYVDMTTGIIYPFAGTGVNGFSGDGGAATAAKFTRVIGLAVNNSGDVFIGDWDNHRIRKVNISTGIVTTVAGNGVLSYSGDGGPATIAALSKPAAICFDTCGNLYFTDEENNRVRRIDGITGIIKTVAGNGTAGMSGDGGPAIAAQFNHPTGICIDKNLNLYVADYYNQRVRKIALGNCEGTGTLVGDHELTDGGISVFPNPVSEFINLKSDKENINSVDIYNLLGQVVIKQRGSGTQHQQVEVSTLPAGIYVVMVNGLYAGKMVKGE
jgi:trimeric autotransporter adhesin